MNSRYHAVALFTMFALAMLGGACVPAKDAAAGAPMAVSSPDGNLSISVALAVKAQPYMAGERLYYRVAYKGVPVLADSPLGLDLSGAGALDHDFEVVGTEKRTNDSTWENAFGAKRTVPDRYNELVVSLREKNAPNRRMDVVLRAYDEGVAFRYVLPKQDAIGELAIAQEMTGFYFARDASAFALNLGRFDTSNEGEYARTALGDIKPASLINLPILVEIKETGLYAALLEADLTDYAGLYVGGVAGVPNALTARLSVAPRRPFDKPVIGATPKSTPWRVIMAGPDAGRFIEANYLILNLSAPCAIADTSWIKPGKAAWDWWSGSYATGVAFKPGMNTATMKHYIDFAARHKFEYMLVDAGWAPMSEDGRIEDILKYRPEVDVPAIIAYGKSKGVETLLWVEWQALGRHMDEAMALYEKWGAAGIKVDYMNRDDQDMVNYYEKVVKKAAEHRLTVDFHGAYKPTGLRRAYPNLLTREGVMGLEYSKWSDRITPEYDVTIPFTRMLAGPMDYTPGAMRNAARGQFEARDIAPMSQGTRAHQLAMYVVYESPLVMVSDYPEAYEGQPGLELIEKVPTVWDDTKVLGGKPAEFIAVARRHGDGWWIGAMTNWDGRDLDLTLDFLGAGEYEATVFADGADAATVAMSLGITKKTVKAGDRLALKLAPGGGAAVMLAPTKTILLASPPPGADGAKLESCTVIGAGRLATVDGSVITSHTDACSECRIQVIPGRTFPKGAMAPVHWGMVYFGAEDDRHALPLGEFGKVIGEIPQVERTYTYFHTGYSQMNERQLAIGESTCSQRAELDIAYVDGLTRQIMTIEQAQVFALERCVTAREAVKLIGGLVEKYGFLPSCGGSESLCIADPRELWTMEICSVGTEWTPESGKPGAIWVARRVPDDHVVVIANYFRIREVDPKSPDVLASPNYMKEAVDRGWYDPKSGRPFIWQEAYAPPVMEGNLSRMWLVTSTLAPSLKPWPKRALNDAATPRTIYAQPFEGASFYPYSFRPEKKVSVRDIIALQRSAFENTIYDMTLDPAWMVPSGGGRLEKSPMASPYISGEMEKVLRIRHHRTIAGQGYGMVAQLRSWLPDAVGGIYWVYVDNPMIGPYAPIYAGATDVSPLYKAYDFREFSEDSARWAYDFVEKLMLLRWQPALKDVQAARDPVESGFFAEQAAVDAKAAAMLKSDPAGAANYLTELTVSRMEKLVDLYRKLRKALLSKYTGDGV